MPAADSGSKDLLLDRWRQLRDAGHLGGLLPGCASRSWEIDGEARGFESFDYRVHRPLGLPGAGADGGDDTADLVELYWSVRTRAGRQDSQWAAALNAHVVQVEMGPLDVTHLDHLYRLAVALRIGLQHGGIGPLMADGAPVALHVRGLLLTPALADPVRMLDALATRADVPLTIGRFEQGPNDAFQFQESGAGQRRWEVGGDQIDRLRRMGETLIAGDRLFRAKGALTPSEPGVMPRWDDQLYDG